MKYMLVFESTLVIHIIAGSLAILFGLLAMSVVKGSKRHIRFGTIFWYTMWGMAGSGIILAAMRDRPVFVLISILSIYLIATGRNALTRPKGAVDRKVWFWFTVVIVCGLAGVALGWWGMTSRDHNLGDPAPLFFGVAFDAFIFAVLDWRLIRRGHARGQRRLIDHLWRMIAAILFALFALFVANPQLFPPWFNETGLNFLPSLAMLCLIIYWILAVRRGSAIAS
ncbi:MAG: hypothetical protein HKN15_07590 [Xanthomonadales bacterium]|nr:hypothetical protein [Xanthomonadales bacterium]